jgi:hypothetical protein
VQDAFPAISHALDVALAQVAHAAAPMRMQNVRQRFISFYPHQSFYNLLRCQSSLNSLINLYGELWQLSISFGNNSNYKLFNDLTSLSVKSFAVS